MLTYLYLSAVFITPIFVTLFFRKAVQENPEATREQLEEFYTRSILFLMGGLVLGVLAPQTELAQSIAQANFALTLMGIVWVQWDYSRALQARSKPVEPGGTDAPSASAFLIQSARGLAFVFLLFVAFHFFGLLAFILFFYTTPVLARLMFRTLPMAASPLRDRIQEVFRGAGVELGHIRIIQSPRKGSANAMVCGSKWGFGPFQRTLFITEGLFQKLDEDEFLAVMRHEAAHLRLHHGRQRVWTLIGIYVLTLILAVIPVYLVLALTIRLQWRHPQLELALGMAAALAALYWINRVIYTLLHRQEHEADVESVRMGSQAEVLSSALQKITVDPGASSNPHRGLWSRWLHMSTHPPLETRLAVLRSGEIPRPKLLPWMNLKMAGAYALMIACTVWLTLTMPARNRDGTQDPSREIATESPRPAKITH